VWVNFAEMVKWLVIILVSITAAGISIPCCIDDLCTDQLSKIPNPEKHQTKGTCSPFFSCASCISSVELAKPIQLFEPVTEKQVHYQRVLKFNLAYFTSTFWQPPRYC